MSDARDSGLHQAPQPPSDLPPGWRYADTESRPVVDPWRQERRRRLVITAVIAVVLVLAAAGVVGWNAQAHYGRGQSALAGGANALAAAELSQATLLGLPYRDAEALEQQARAALTSDLAEGQADAARRERVLARLTRAAAALRSGEAAAVLAEAEAAGKAGLTAVAAGSQDVADVERRLLGDTELAARAALAGGSWKDAGLLAGALIVLDGDSEDWARLSRRAEKGARLKTVVGRARAAAGRGSWSAALRLARRVLAEDHGFPGAARVAARARAALAAARARAAAAAAAAAAADSGASGGTPATSGTGSTSTQPPPP